MPLSENSANDLFNEACQQLLGIKYASLDNVWRNVLVSLTDDAKVDLAQKIGVEKLTPLDLKNAFKNTTQYNRLKRWDVDLLERVKHTKGFIKSNTLAKLVKMVYFRTLETASKPKPEENLNDILIEITKSIRPFDEANELEYLRADSKGGERLKEFVVHILPDYFNEAEKDKYHQNRFKISDDQFSLAKVKYPKYE